MKNVYINMICVDSEGNSVNHNLIKISDLLKIHNLEVNLPKPVLDIGVDKNARAATVTITENGCIFKWETSTSNYNITYSIILNSLDSKKTVVELEDGDVIQYYSMDGSLYVPS